MYRLKADNDQIFKGKWYLEILRGIISDGIIKRLNNYTVAKHLIMGLKILITYFFFITQL